VLDGQVLVSGSGKHAVERQRLANRAVHDIVLSMHHIHSSNVVHSASIPFYRSAACSCCIASLVYTWHQHCYCQQLLQHCKPLGIAQYAYAPQSLGCCRSHCLNPAANHNVAQFVLSPAACSACIRNLAYAGIRCFCMTCQSAVAAHISAWFSRVFFAIFSLKFQYMCKPVPISSCC
jgi:hypothetical protein